MMASTVLFAKKCFMAWLFWGVNAGIRRMFTSQFLKWRIPTSRKWEQGRMLTFNFVGGRAYNHLYF
jgi:hypothetical protein